MGVEVVNVVPRLNDMAVFVCVFVEEINRVESRDVPPPLFLVKSSNSAFSQRGKQGKSG